MKKKIQKLFKALQMYTTTLLCICERNISARVAEITWREWLSIDRISLMPKSVRNEIQYLFVCST